MHRFIADVRIWPDGDVWSIVESDEAGTRSEDWERTFPAPIDGSSDVETPLNVLEIGPDPSGPCASLGIWASVNGGGLRKWDESDQSWIDVTSPDKPQLTDFTCREDGTLLASSVKGGLYTNADGSWERFRPEVDASLQSTTILNGTVYAGGSRGTLFEASESNSRPRANGPERNPRLGLPAGGGSHRGRHLSRDSGEISLTMGATARCIRPP